MKKRLCVSILIIFGIGLVSAKDIQRAYLAGGCFWCTESTFEKIEGVSEVYSGYSGGTKANPTYKQVSTGTTGHIETVEIVYDADIVSFAQLLNVLWKEIDPTDAYGQFADRGSQYAPAVFYQNREEKEIAEQSLKNLDNSGYFDKPVAVKLIKFEAFYKAEEEHQNYAKNNALSYGFYRRGSGRERFLEKIWGKHIKYLEMIGKKP